MTDTHQITADDRRAVASVKTRIDAKMKRLRDLVPAVLDLSCRECVLPSTYGHTLSDKNDLLGLSHEFGSKIWLSPLL